MVGPFKSTGGGKVGIGTGSASGKYRLLLEDYGLELKVLNSQTNRYKDIQIGAGRTASIYKFAMNQYQRAEKKTAPQDDQ